MLNRVQDLRQYYLTRTFSVRAEYSAKLSEILFDMCVYFACRIECECCSQSHRHVRFFVRAEESSRLKAILQYCACRIEYKCCSQSHLICAYLCVPNRVQDLKVRLT